MGGTPTFKCYQDRKRKNVIIIFYCLFIRFTEKQHTTKNHQRVAWGPSVALGLILCGPQIWPPTMIQNWPIQHR